MGTFKNAFLARKLDRVAAAYAVAGWLLVQGASIVLPAFGAPAWALKFFIALVLAGFPIAIWLSWHAVPHPHYRRSTPPASTYTDIALLSLLGAVVLLSVAQLVFQIRLVPVTPRSSPGVDSAAAFGSGATTAGQSPAASIAVLPFINMSGDPTKEYFSDGVSEELLNDLANAPNLRVAARTSSFAFKGRNEDIRTIARALNVHAILEGSVRESGEQIRITAQLISAADGYHLWSKTYDRNLGNILVVQDEIAREITTALTHRLLGSGSNVVARRQSTINPDAYRKYLEAQWLSARKTDESDGNAIRLLRQVTVEQPDFAPGFVALGRVYLHWAELHEERPDLVSAAGLALHQALSLDPNNLEALFLHLVLALVNWDWQDAAQDAHRLRSINPHSVFTLRGLGFFYGGLGFPDRQIAALKGAIALDPLSFVDLNNLATSLSYRGQYRDAAANATAALVLQPGRPLALYTLCWAYSGMNRIGDASAVLRQLSGAQEQGAADACSLRIAAATRDRLHLRSLADKIGRRFPVFVFDETDVAEFYAAAGDFDRAIAWCEKAYAAKNYDLFASESLANMPAGSAAAGRWRMLMQRPEARKWQAVHAASEIQPAGP
ncbi:MAG TPA: hypothetical protein VII49_00495 [Rhizomicrobium sp.]